MNIRPMDMQVLIPRATEIAKSQNHLDQQGVLQQQQFSEQLQKMAENRQRQVQSTSKNEGGKIKGDQEREKHPSQQQGESENTQKHAGADTAENTPSNMDPVRGHTIDIKT